MNQQHSLTTWQAAYQTATGKQGKVINVYGELRFYGLMIVVEVQENGGDRALYSPYCYKAPFGEEPFCPLCYSSVKKDNEVLCAGHDFQIDTIAWIEDMQGATEWGNWKWTNLLTAEEYQNGELVYGGY